MLRPQPERRIWADHLWPVVGGSLAGIGAIGTVQAYGVLGAVALYGSLAVFTAATLACVAQQASLSITRAVRWGFTIPLVVLAVLGLAHAFEVFGLLAALGVALTSPTALRAAVRLRPPSAPPAGAVRATPALSARTVRIEQEAVRRRFEEMVAGLDDPDDFSA